MNKKIIIAVLIAVALAFGGYYFLKGNNTESLESLNEQMIKECGHGKVISGTPECLNVLNKIHTLYPTNGTNVTTPATDATNTAPVAPSAQN